ncbi:group II intron maturase-specific domain-containing protein, partial [Desulfogranum marinum]|uniref:group II intron maturase-specific domain-containing protein n=1 Tax=Desulfogranum marinum TaxID=453220 RepID=UPI002FC8E7F6|nr:hypothetical protein [Desulfogranum marinum]
AEGQGIGWIVLRESNLTCLLIGDYSMQRLDDRSRMSGDAHVRFCESLRGKFPRATRLVILVKSRRAGERVMASVSRFLEKRLKLKVNQEKSKVAHTNEITFLGFSFTGAKIRWSNKVLVRFKQRIKELTGRSWGVSMDYRLFKLAEYLRGWMGYFGISELYRPIPELDHWLRRRMRMCYWKQWRYCRTKVRELTKLGTFQHTAISVGLSRKGPWRLSRTLATHSGMTNQWLKDQGLLSIKDLWVNVHYPATAR